MFRGVYKHNIASYSFVYIPSRRVFEVVSIVQVEIAGRDRIGQGLNLDWSRSAEKILLLFQKSPDVRGLVKVYTLVGQGVRTKQPISPEKSPDVRGLVKVSKADWSRYSRLVKV